MVFKPPILGLYGYGRHIRYRNNLTIFTNICYIITILSIQILKQRNDLIHDQKGPNRRGTLNFGNGFPNCRFYVLSDTAVIKDTAIISPYTNICYLIIILSIQRWKRINSVLQKPALKKSQYDKFNFNVKLTLG